MSGKRWIALGIAALLLIVSAGFQFVSTIASANIENMFGGVNNNGVEEELIDEGQPQEKIAVIDIEGVIQDTGDTPSFMNQGMYNHRQFLKMLESAGENRAVKGIILRVNTPGGGVVESAEIHDKVQEIQEEHNKPVYVSMGNTAASGGYYVAAPADKIVAHPATVTGSIGVIMQSINYSDLAEQIGVEFNTIKSGPFKDILSGNRDMTEEEEEILQGMVDDFYADFVQVIADGRDMPEDRVREIGDGRVYSGKQAQDIDLVDELGSLEDTITMMTEEQDLSNPQVVRYHGVFSFNQFLGTSARSLFVQDAELLGLKDLLMESQAPRAMYLYTE
ncbi:protease-4 [Alteribacillus persepolensis]|uniref:Protease-4 n=1 Tax=Alteribacillus persepolensis TaxID=568899 RepID=A0A1G8BFZ2_9BACI|nr:signal peptide peptidase SppA [Alteribacillus persepolensis]SDH31974.1 protease-4 [Alteribacillus persepolensis]